MNSEILLQQNKLNEANLDDVRVPKILSRVQNGWMVEFGNGEQLWDGMTGPRLRSRPEWVDWTNKVFGFNIQNRESEGAFDEVKKRVSEIASEHLIPNVNGEYNPRERSKKMIFHAGSRATGDYKNEYERIKSGVPAPHYDIWTGVRAGFFAHSGDMIVGRNIQEVIGPEKNGIQHVEIGNDDFYYSYDALAEWIYNDPNLQNPDNPACRLVEYLSNNPDASISIYASGFEETAVLLYLQKHSGVEKIKIEANSPFVDSMNTKTILHGDIDEVLNEIPNNQFKKQDDVLNQLKKEKKHSELAKVFGEELIELFPSTPGCSIKSSEDYDQFKNKVSKLNNYFYDRYGITKICAKPAISADGEGIIFNIDPRNKNYLDELSKKLFNLKRDFIFEPQLTFNQYIVGDEVRQVTPSAHVINGNSFKGYITNQRVSPEGVWMGNDVINKKNADLLNINEMFQRMDKYMDRIAKVARENELGLSVMGIDFFSGMVKSDNPLIAGMVFTGPGDPNIRQTGAMYAYEAYNKVWDELEKNGVYINGQDIVASTHVITPKVNYEELNRYVEMYKYRYQSINDKKIYGTVASCKNGWGMVYSSGVDVHSSSIAVNDLVEFLKSNNLIM